MFVLDGSLVHSSSTFWESSFLGVPLGFLLEIFLFGNTMHHVTR